MRITLNLAMIDFPSLNHKIIVEIKINYMHKFTLSLIYFYVSLLNKLKNWINNFYLKLDSLYYNTLAPLLLHQFTHGTFTFTHAILKYTSTHQTPHTLPLDNYSLTFFSLLLLTTPHLLHFTLIYFPQQLTPHITSPHFTLIYFPQQLTLHITSPHFTRLSTPRHMTSYLYWSYVG